MASGKDWHPEEIKAAIRMTGVSVSELAEINGVSRASLRQAFQRPWPRMEEIIAAHLKHHPSTIWPSRYGWDARPLTGRVRRAKPTASSAEAHRQKDPVL